MEEVSKEVRLELTNRKLEIWNNTLYDAGLDDRIARVTKNTAGEKSAQERMKSALQAIDLLEKEIKEIEEEKSET